MIHRKAIGRSITDVDVHERVSPKLQQKLLRVQGVPSVGEYSVDEEKGVYRFGGRVKQNRKKRFVVRYRLAGDPGGVFTELA